MPRPTLSPRERGGGVDRTVNLHQPTGYVNTRPRRLSDPKSRLCRFLRRCFFAITSREWVSIARTISDAIPVAGVARLRFFGIH